MSDMQSVNIRYKTDTHTHTHPNERKLKKGITKFLRWIVMLYRLEKWTTRKEDIKRLEALEKWIWQRMEGTQGKRRDTTNGGRKKICDRRADVTNGDIGRTHMAIGRQRTEKEYMTVVDFLKLMYSVVYTLKTPFSDKIFSGWCVACYASGRRNIVRGDVISEAEKNVSICYVIDSGCIFSL